MPYLICYEFAEAEPSPHRIFIEEAERNNLLYVYMGPNHRLCRLPQMTLWGPFGLVDEARDAFDEAREAAELRLDDPILVEKLVVTRLMGSVFSALRKSPDPRWTASHEFETCRQHQLHDPFFAY
jgi:hypothetical protein